MKDDIPYDELVPLVKARDKNKCVICGRYGPRKTKDGKRVDYNRVVNAKWPDRDSMDSLETRCKTHSKDMD